jgi:hypothetical protein
VATVPGFADVALQLILTGLNRPAYITFGIDPADTDPMTIAGAVNTAASTAGSLMSIMDSNVTLRSVRVSLGTDGSEDVVGVLTATTIGGLSKTSLPPNCACLVHKLSARGGRRGRGRVFIPWCIDEGVCDEAGIITPAAVTPIQAAMNVFRGALSSGGNPMVLLHEPSQPGVAHPSTPGAPNVVTALVVDPLISTQRRRLGR